MKKEYYVTTYGMDEYKMARLKFESLDGAFAFARGLSRKSLVIHVCEVSENEAVETLIAEVLLHD